MGYKILMDHYNHSLSVCYYYGVKKNYPIIGGRVARLMANILLGSIFFTVSFSPAEVANEG